LSVEHPARFGLDSWLVFVSPDPRARRHLDLGLTAAAETNSSSFHLAVVPSSTGGIPALSEDSGTVVLFDGVLHDLPGSRAEAGADEILRLYRSQYPARGDDAFSSLRGSFVTLVLDERADGVLALRDPMGAHPLFSTNDDGITVFSPSLEALASAIPGARRPNRLYLAAELCNREIGAAATYFEGIERVPAGHVLRLDRGSVHVGRYWDPGPVAGRERWSDGRAHEAFDRLLSRAVARCLAHGPAGVFMSGGIDSTTIAAVARDESERRGLPGPLALSLLFPDPACNEELVQRAVAEALEIPQIVSQPEAAIDDRGLLERTVETIVATGSSASLGYLTPAYDGLVEAGIERGCGILLSGEGGDEWLQVHPDYCFGGLVRQLKFRELVYLLRSHRRYTAADSTAAFLRLFLWEAAAVGFARQIARETLERLALSPPFGWAADALLDRQYARLVPPWAVPDRTLREELVDRWRALAVERRELDAYTRSRRRFLNHHGTSVLGEASFARARSLGLLTFDPYLDPDVVEFLYRASPTALAFGRRARGLAHASLAKRVRSVPSAQPVFFDSFVAQVGRIEAPRVLERLGGIQVLSELGVIDANAVTRESLTSAQDAGIPLTEVLALEAWVRAWSFADDRGGVSL
jgi:asparagine synthetase B (glutamine-hydrolysing)